MRTGLLVGLLGIGAVLLLVIGVAVLVHALRQQRHRRRLVVATGVVTEVRVHHPDRPAGEQSLPLRFPTVRFTTPDGRIHEAEVGQAFSWERHQPGRRIAIRYDPADPRRIFPASGAGPLLWGCIGGLFLSVGLVFSVVAAGAALLLLRS